MVYQNVLFLERPPSDMLPLASHKLYRPFRERMPQ